uniref:SnoaL-like domain-containing protein n=1 Tax=Caenorhabditis tropicalis TaxID=1561998 RepID=A0A1I7UYM3_9PELO
MAPETAYGKLKEITGGCEKMSVKEVEEFYGRVDRGDFFETNKENDLNDYPEIMAMIVDSADIQTRRMLSQTNREFNRLTTTRPFYIKNLTIILHVDYMKVQADSDILIVQQNKKMRTKHLSGYASVIQNMGNVWTTHFEITEPELIQDAVKWFSSQPNLRIKNLWVEDSRGIRNIEGNQLRVENLYTNSFTTRQWHVPA